MNQITNPPNDNYTFGYGFDYAVWDANSIITMTNVPWNNDYRDVVMFPTTNDLNRYIDQSETARIDLKSTYAKANQPIRINVPFNAASRFNYIRVYNPGQPLNGFPRDENAYFYYFIVGVEYIAPNTTEIIVQLDIWQTYVRRVTFGRCFVERGHVGIANEHGFRNYGRDYLSIQEGLDTGGQMVPISRKNVQYMTSQNSTQQGGEWLGHNILIASTARLDIDPGTVAAPKLAASTGSVLQGVPSGISYYVFLTDNDFLAAMRKFAATPWISNSIISISVIPDVRRYTSNLGAKNSFGGYSVPGFFAAQKRHVIGANWRESAGVLNYIPERYRHLKKFLTYPYMAIRVRNNLGSEVIIRPEEWQTDDGEFLENAYLAPPHQEVRLTPQMGPNSSAFAMPSKGFLKLAITNNNSLMYLAQNARGIAMANQSADWSQNKAMLGNETAFQQANAAMGGAVQSNTVQNANDATQLGISNQLQRDNFAVNAIGGALSSAAGGLVGGPMGAAIGAGTSAASSAFQYMGMNNSIAASEASLSANIAARGQQLDIAQGVSGFIRDTNKAYADFAARGDYAMSIASIQAKIQDSYMTPPSLVGQVDGEGLAYVTNQFFFAIDILMPNQAVINSIGEYWLRYGYAVQRFMMLPPSLMVMEKFTYWKLSETYIRAAGMPEVFKQGIRGLLEKGITVWKDPNDIGFIDPADNKPLRGIVIDGYTPPPPTPDPDPEPPVTRPRKAKKMLVYSTISTNPASPGNLWALAGASPGTNANFQETQDPVRAKAFLDACQQTEAIGLTETEFNDLRLTFLSPVRTVEG